MKTSVPLARVIIHYDLLVYMKRMFLGIKDQVGG